MIFAILVNIVLGVSMAIIHWADSAYFDRRKAHEQCNAMNRSITDDQNYLAYVVGPIPLD